MINPFIFLQPKKIKEKRHKLQQKNPIVVMARGHSGTRVLAWILHHLGVAMWSDEDRASGDTNRKLNRKIKLIAKCNPYITEKGKYNNYLRILLENAFYTYYENLGQPDSAWGWKFPESYLIAPLIRDIFPKARFIHMVRDGRDLAFKEHLTDDPQRKVGKKLLKRIEALQDPHHIQAAKSWNYQLQTFHYFKKQHLSDEQIFELKFEDLIQNPQGQAESLCSFLGLSMTEKAKDYINNEIIKDKVKQHREEPRPKVIEVEEHIASTLDIYDYELYGGEV